jgi:hypothetical protein
MTYRNIMYDISLTGRLLDGNLVKIDEGIISILL